MNKIMIKNTIDINKFNPNDWSEVVVRSNYPLFNSLLGFGVIIKNKDLNFDNRVRHQLLLNPKIYSLNKELKKLEKIIFTAARKKNFLPNYLNKIENDCDDYLKIIKAISKKKDKNINI